MDRVKRIWYLLPMRAAKVQASLRIRAVSPEPSLLAHTSRESRGIFRQKARSLAALNGWACAVKICHDGMLEDTNSLDGAQMSIWKLTILRKIPFKHNLFEMFVKSIPFSHFDGLRSPNRVRWANQSALIKDKKYPFTHFPDIHAYPGNVCR